MTRALFLAIAACGVSAPSIQSRRFVPGEVMARFAAGSEWNAAVARAAAAQPVDPSLLTPIATRLGTTIGVPLRPARLASGNYCVLSVDVPQLGEQMAKSLGTRRGVARAHVVPDSGLALVVEFHPGSPEAGTLTNRSRVPAFITALEKELGVPLTGDAQDGRLALRINLEALTLSVVDKLTKQAGVESAQPNYVLAGFGR